MLLLALGMVLATQRIAAFWNSLPALGDPLSFAGQSRINEGMKKTQAVPVDAAISQEGGSPREALPL